MSSWTEYLIVYKMYLYTFPVLQIAHIVFYRNRSNLYIIELLSKVDVANIFNHLVRKHIQIKDGIQWYLLKVLRVTSLLLLTTIQHFIHFNCNGFSSQLLYLFTAVE